MNVHRTLKSFAWRSAIFLATAFSLTTATFGSDLHVLFNMAGQGYALSRKDVAPLEDAPRLLAIADDGDPKLRPLARLIIARDLVAKSKMQAEETFGEDLRAAVASVRSATFDSAARQSIAQFLGDDVSVPDEFTKIVGQVGHVAVDGIRSQAKTYEIARNGWILEGMICDEAQRLLTAGLKSAAELPKEDIFVRSLGYKSRDQPYAAFNVTNKSEKSLEWAIVILRVECEYKTPENVKVNNSVGQSLGQALFGARVPDYVGRERAVEAYSNIDKCAMFFVEDWQPRRIMQIVSVKAPEYFATAKSVSVRVFCEEGHTEETVRLDRHKKDLRDKYAPRQRRRR